MIEIVKASIDDLPHILPLVLEYYKEDRKDVVADDALIEEHLASMLNWPMCAIIGAVDGDEVLGVAGLAVGPSLGAISAEEVFWKIKKGHTKSKAGTLMMKALEAAADELGAETMTVVALAGEHEARVGNSYKSRGYDPVCSTYTKRLG